MPLSTNVPAVQFTPTGLVLPDEAAILAGVQADQNAAFGGGLDPALETPQGQLAQSQTAVIGDANNLFAALVNGIDPATAEGRMQDAIGRFYFLDRKGSLPSTVAANCSGLSGTVIPLGALASDVNGNLWASLETGTIPLGGVVSLQFAAVVPGPVALSAGDLSRIYQAVPGWDSITNPSDAIPGRNTETRAEFEYRRAQSVALNGHGSLQSIYASVFNVDDVLDVYVYENNTGANINVGATGYTLIPHSLYVAAVGGVTDAVAKAIWLKKDVGADYNGNTTVTVYDDSGYSAPLPSYTVKFERPDSLPIGMAIEIAASPSLPNNIVSLVKDAVVRAFNGEDGGQRARIGSTIYASRYYCAISALSPAIGINSFFLGSGGATPALSSVTAGIDEVPTIDPADIAVTLV